MNRGKNRPTNQTYPEKAMKTLPPISLACLLPGVLAVTFLIFASGAHAQVKIPAKSESSLDNTEADSVSSGVPQPSRSQFQNNSNVSRSAPAGPTGLKQSPAPLPKPGAVTAVQRVESPKQNLNPERMKRLAELRRELRISEIATQAKMSLPADDIFEVTAPTTINDLSEPTLQKVAEYLELVGLKKITVKPFYVSTEEGAKELSWARSLALIEWMTSHSKVPLENFKAAGPEPVVKATPKKYTKNVGETEFVNRIDLLLEQ